MVCSWGGSLRPSLDVSRVGATLRVVVAGRTPLEERWSRPAVMGVVNVTPDSFSDGGRFFEPDGRDRTTAGGSRAEGAAIVDVGGESTRPGAEPVTADEELRRVEPVLEGLRDPRLDRHLEGESSHGVRSSSAPRW